MYSIPAGPHGGMGRKRITCCMCLRTIYADSAHALHCPHDRVQTDAELRAIAQSSTVAAEAARFLTMAALAGVEVG